MKNSFLFIKILVVFLSLSATSQQVLSQPVQLSEGYQDVGLYHFTAGIPKFLESHNGTHVVYLSGEDDNFAHRIFSAPTTGSGPVVELTSKETSSARYFEISPNGKRVVFATYESLYSVPIEGGVPIRLNDNLIAPINDFKISSDSNTVVFMNDQDLWAVSILGGDNTKVTVGQPEGGYNFSSFRFSPDNEYVFYRFFRRTEEGEPIHGLYRADIGGGQTILDLLPQLEVSQRITNFLLSADGNSIAYQIDDFEGPSFIGSVSIGGDARSHYIAKSRTESLSLLALSADGSNAYFSIGESYSDFKKIMSVSLNQSSSIVNEVVNVGNLRMEYVHILRDKKGVVFSTFDVSRGMREVKFKSVEAINEPAIILARLKSNQLERPDVFLNANESVMTLLSENHSVGFTDQHLTVIDLVQRSSRLIANRQFPETKTDDRIYNVMTSNSSKRVFFLDGVATPSQNVALKSLSSNGGAAFPLSWGLTDAPTVFNYQLSHDEKRIFFTAGSVRGDRARFKLFAVDVDRSEEELCFPLKAKNQKLATVCL